MLNHHLLLYRHPFQFNILHLILLYHHFHGFIADLGHVLNGTIPVWTNVQFPFQEVQGEKNQSAVHVTDVDTPTHETDPDVQVMLPQSPSGQLLHDVVKYYGDETMILLAMIKATDQHPFNLHRGTINTTTHLQRPTKTTMIPTTVRTINIPPTSGNPGINGKIIPKPPTIPIPQDGSTIQSHHTSINPTTILLPNTHQNHSRHFLPTTLHMAMAITHVDLAPSNLGPPLSLPDTLPSTSKKALKRNGHIRHALHHPDRMRAANELASNERPEPSLSIVHAEYDEAMEQIHKVDSRLPPDIARKAVQLFFSTGLLPAYDLSNSHVRELPQTSMLALVMPLPDISRFQMPNPFGGQSNITWALCHGTTLRTSQLILMEGKIRPANWSYHPNPQRCHLPTFGAFYIGRQVSNADQDFPSWAEQELLDSMEKKGKGQQEITVGAMYRGSRDHLALKAGGNEKGQLNVIEKGIVTTPEKYTIAPSNHVGLKFIAIKWADLKSTDSSPRRPIDLRDTDSEDNVNYRTNEERHADRRRGWALKTALSARVLLAYVVLNRILHSFLGFTWTNALVKSASLFLFLLLFCEGFGFLVGLLSLVFFFFFWATFFWASCWKDHDR